LPWPAVEVNLDTDPGSLAPGGHGMLVEGRFEIALDQERTAQDAGRTFLQSGATRNVTTSATMEP
jgi:hypothetical protein